MVRTYLCHERGTYVRFPGVTSQTLVFVQYLMQSKPHPPAYSTYFFADSMLRGLGVLLHVDLCNLPQNIDITSEEKKKKLDTGGSEKLEI